MLMDLEHTKQYKVGDIIRENIPFVSFDNLTSEGYNLYGNSLLDAIRSNNEELVQRIKKSVRHGKKHTFLTENYLSDSISIFRQSGHVYYDDDIKELEVFPWTYMTK